MIWHRCSLFFTDFHFFIQCSFFFVFCSQTCLGKSQTAQTFKIFDALGTTGRNPRRQFYWFIAYKHVSYFFLTFCLCMFAPTANKKNISNSPIMALNLASISSPAADSVHSALVSEVSKAGMSDFTESVAPKSIQKALPTEWNFCWRKDFSLTVNLLYDT